MLGLRFYAKTKKITFPQFSQPMLVLLLQFLLMWSLGGFAAGSVVMLWAIFSPIGGLMFLEKRNAMRLLLAFLVLVLISVLIDRTVAATFPLYPTWP